MATPTPSPLAAYRHLLRATRIAFYGDWPTMHAARNEARARFDANKVASVDTAMKIQEAEEAARILRHNIVQGRLVAEAEQAAAEGNAEKERELRYQLRIHDDIERGDNDSVKIAGKGNVKVDKCCSS